MDGGDVVWTCGRAVAGRPNCCEDLFFIEGVEIRVKFMDFPEFPTDFTGGRVLLVGFYGGELFGETRGNGGGLGEGFVGKVDGLVGGRVRTLSRQGTE